MRRQNSDVPSVTMMSDVRDFGSDANYKKDHLRCVLALLLLQTDLYPLQQREAQYNGHGFYKRRPSACVLLSTRLQVEVLY